MGVRWRKIPLPFLLALPAVLVLVGLGAAGVHDALRASGGLESVLPHVGGVRTATGGFRWSVPHDARRAILPGGPSSLGADSLPQVRFARPWDPRREATDAPLLVVRRDAIGAGGRFPRGKDELEELYAWLLEHDVGRIHADAASRFADATGLLGAAAGARRHPSAWVLSVLVPSHRGRATWPAR
jgi:hypothetical protein